MGYSIVIVSANSFIVPQNLLTLPTSFKRGDPP